MEGYEPKKRKSSGASKSGGGSSNDKNDDSAQTSGTSSSNKDGGSSTSAVSPALDARVRLGASLFQLNGAQLGEVMTFLELECPEILESVTPGLRPHHVEINLDDIPPAIFASLNALVAEKVGHGKLLPGSPDGSAGGEDGGARPKKKRKS